MLQRLSLCLLLTCYSPLAAVGTSQEAIQEQAQETLWKRSKRWIRKGVSLIPGVGKPASAFLFGSAQQEALEIQKNILKTNNSSLSQLKELAQDALRTKQKIEELNRLKKEALRLAQDFKKIHYNKLLLGVEEDLLEVNLDPSIYIPATAYTQKLQKNLKLSYWKDKQVLGHSKGLLRNTRKAFCLKALNGGYKNAPAFEQALQKATHYDRTVAAYVASRNQVLANQYEQLADGLLQQNKAFQKLMEQKEAAMTPAETLQAYHVLHHNIKETAQLKARANELLAKGTQLSDTEKEAIATEQDRLFLLELIEMERETKRGKHANESLIHSFFATDSPLGFPFPAYFRPVLNGRGTSFYAFCAKEVF